MLVIEGKEYHTLRELGREFNRTRQSLRAAAGHKSIDAIMVADVFYATRESVAKFCSETAEERRARLKKESKERTKDAPKKKCPGCKEQFDRALYIKAAGGISMYCPDCRAGKRPRSKRGVRTRATKQGYATAATIANGFELRVRHVGPFDWRIQLFFDSHFRRNLLTCRSHGEASQLAQRLINRGLLNKRQNKND